MTWASHKGVIYLVDDDSEFLVTLQEALEAAGYYVLPARDGKEALARMKGLYGNSVAIVDLIMPRMSGWELIETMRADRNLSTIPILAMSSEFTLKKGRPAAGADRVIPKPFDVPKLLRAVDELMIN